MALGQRTVKGSVFVKQRAGRAGGHTRPAIGTGRGFTERCIEIHDDLIFHAPIPDVEGVDAFHFITRPDAARAENATVVVKPQILAGQVHRERWIQIGITDRINPMDISLVLQTAIALVERADRADMIPLAEKQFQRQLAQIAEPVIMRHHGGAICGRRGARRHHLGAAGDFHDAHPAPAPGRQILHVTQRRNHDPVGMGDFENRLPLGSDTFFSVDGNGNFFGGNH